MLGLGWPEILLILGVMILIFGPKRLPELGGALGKTLRGFQEEIKPESAQDDADVVEANATEYKDNPSEKPHP